MFAISNQDFGAKAFGVVVQTFSFEWDTGNNTEYSMIFNNKFDAASPSYHDKTVEVSVTEVGPSNSVNLYFLVEVVGIAAVIIATITASTILVLLRRRKYEPSRGPTSYVYGRSRTSMMCFALEPGSWKYSSRRSTLR